MPGESLISTPAGILAALCGTCAIFFLLERRSGWRLFHYLPPLIWIYLVPMILSNNGVLPTRTPVYDWIGTEILPVMLCLLLLRVDVLAAFRLMGKGVFVMLFGTAGVVVGAPVAFLMVRGHLGPDGWKAFGALAGSWIGGTGNMASVGEMIGADGTEIGLAVLGDNLVYLVWLPLLLASRSFAGVFARWTRVDPERVGRMEAAARRQEIDERPPEMAHYLYLLGLGFALSWLAGVLAERLPEVSPFLTPKTWRILAVTTGGILLSLTPARRIPGSFPLGMALLYVFVARMGASADLSGVATQAPWFVLGALVWILIHGASCLLGARLFRVDIHSAAIASAANIGGAASAALVASYHNKDLVPAGVLMALLGYAVGNYAGWLAAILCSLLALA